MTSVVTPSENTITTGQIGKLEDLLGARLRKSGLPSTAVQRVIETHGDIIADQMLAIVRKHVESVNVLTKRGHADIVLSAQRVPKSFFKDRNGLWVWADFRDNVAARAETSEVGMTFSVNFHEITSENGATDEQIEIVLGDNHLFDETQVCAIISEMISAQEGGKEGVLLHNGYANLFYTASLVVSVRWDAGRGEWGVGTWERDGRRWRQGTRVFVPSN